MVDVKTEKASLTTENNTGSTQLTRPGNFCLAHLSDLHLTSLNNTAISPLLNKRMLGYLSWWRKRRFVHRSEIVEALLEDLKTTRPDHIAVTGDLTHLGLPDEFAEAAQWLSQLGPPDQVTVIPGNHEAYVGQDWADQLSVWAAYLKSDNEPEHRHKTGFFPSLRIRGPIALLGLCSARPSLPFLAVGSLDQKQLDTFAKLLQKTGDAGLLRVILVHHPPVPGSIKWRKRLDNSSA
ncbi:MAG: metallophosphoesterase, partial [Desulfuromonadales bacterium]